MNRAEATWELIKTDRASAPGKVTVPGAVQDAAVKGYGAISNALPALMTPLDQNDYSVVARTSPISATVNSVRNTLKARWFNKGNPLNLIPKAIAAVTETTDGAIQDILHLGGSKNGSVIRAI
jgi:hypothetical protein